MKNQPIDPYFRVELISATPDPQRVVYAAMHQDYSEGFVYDEMGFGHPGSGTYPIQLEEKEAGKIAVKRLLAGNRGHYGCYSADTEVLTSEGWKRWDTVSDEDHLLAVNIDSQSAQFEKPTSIQSVAVQEGEKLYSVESAYINLMVTQDHRMVVSHRRKNGTFSEWEVRQAHEVANKPVRYLLNCCLNESSRIIPEGLPNSVNHLTALKVAGFFFGDGLRSNNIEPGTVRFRIRRPRKIAYLLSLGIPIARMEGDHYVIRDKELASWVHSTFSSTRGKIVPNWLLKLPQEMIAAFWDGLKNSDGTRVTSKGWAYDSCEKEAIDIIQATAHLNGFSANLYLNNPNEGDGHENHRPCWRLSISERSTYRVETCQKSRSPGVTESFVEYEGMVYCATVSTGALLVRKNGKVVVCGNCFEHPQIVLNFGHFPHSVMQQLRTHRIGVSFDVQSFRYTGTLLVDAANRLNTPSPLKQEESCRDIVDSVVYLRPVGSYTDRQGKKYDYTEQRRYTHVRCVMDALNQYADDIAYGMSEEHARGMIPFDVRQNWVMSLNLRSLMAIMLIRGKADAQLEIQQLCQLTLPHFQAWCPEIYDWYMENLWQKGRLAP